MSFVLCAWFFTHKKPDYYEELTLKLTDSEIPYIGVSIEGDQYSMVIDLGSRFEMDIKSDVLKNLSKLRLGTEKWRNFRGNEFTRPSYILPKIEIGSLVFNNPSAVETLLLEVDDCIIWRDPNEEKKYQKTVGSLGRKFFKSLNLLFDVQRSKMIATNNLNKLKNNGYDLKTYLKTPFELHSKGIILQVNTDVGVLRLLLDTGATSTFIHDKLYPLNMERVFDCRGLPTLNSQLFSISGRDFGEKKLYFLAMTDEIQEFDGALGMDFIKEHVMYIDFFETEIYLQ